MTQTISISTMKPWKQPFKIRFQWVSYYAQVIQAQFYISQLSSK